MAIERSEVSQARQLAPAGRLREERAVGELAQRFTYQTIEEIPPGVNPKQLDFLRDASNIGAFMHVRPQTAKLITEYFTTEVTYADLATQYGVSQAAVTRRVHRGLEKLHTVLHQKKTTLAVDNTYPLEEIKKENNRFQNSRLKFFIKNASAISVGDYSRNCLWYF